ncbi:hypothetical protein [Alteriqipengyuania lutimaris]|uniref:Uncharacterized protein n=1 Tax=Alteriqipengyuania lutimaris TaxID=1538146 RepID=A0A395LHR0_9SPHN|nr:hypothetical protein [Alteriqipengyuania lutimaris]MBB3034722.1 hypothetical protein [Alteriqipengyuania lutimaris]RDS76423.1 hypothetical protein DL238_01570 [Alteriqipengyuania lutimaris]
MASPDPETLQLPTARLVSRDPVARTLMVFLAGMILLLAIDLASEPRGRLGEDRAIESALADGNQAFSKVTQAGEPGEPPPGDAERHERARSAAFFLEQAGLAWRRGEAAPPEQLRVERGGAVALAFLGKLWVLGWLMLPVGAFASRLACPHTEGRDRRWALHFGARALGGSAGLIALAVTAYRLGVPAPFAFAPLATAIVVLNAWLLAEHARLDRAATLLRLGPILVILTVALMLARELLLGLGLLP